jgi:P27 family predicted phage terminase small subunit
MPAHRKSIEVHELHGTKPQRAADVSNVPAGRPKFPRDLDQSLKPTFKRLCNLLADRRVLTAGDVELIRLYCFQHDRHTRNVAALREEGEICTYVRFDANGAAHDVVKANIRLKIVVEAERQMASVLNQLGLTPTAKDRAKITRSSEQTIVPGSMADQMPELVGIKSAKPAFQFVLSEEDRARMAALDAEIAAEPEERVDEDGK